MLDDVEHELVIKQPDQVETAETGGAAESEIPGDDIDDIEDIDEDRDDDTMTTCT